MFFLRCIRKAYWLKLCQSEHSHGINKVKGSLAGIFFLGFANNAAGLWAGI